LLPKAVKAKSQFCGNAPMPSHRSPTIIVLYDHDCHLLCTELLSLKANDQRHQIKLVNIRGAAFSARAWGFAPESLATTLHVRDLAGYWHIALDAIDVLYRAVGVTPPVKRLALPDLRVGFVTILAINRLNRRVGTEPVLDGAAGSSIRQCSNDDYFIAEVNDKNSRA